MSRPGTQIRHQITDQREVLDHQPVALCSVHSWTPINEYCFDETCRARVSKYRFGCCHCIHVVPRKSAPKTLCLIAFCPQCGGTCTPEAVRLSSDEGTVYPCLGESSGLRLFD